MDMILDPAEGPFPHTYFPFLAIASNANNFTHAENVCVEGHTTQVSMEKLSKMDKTPHFRPGSRPLQTFCIPVRSYASHSISFQHLTLMAPTRSVSPAACWW